LSGLRIVLDTVLIDGVKHLRDFLSLLILGNVLAITQCSCYRSTSTATTTNVTLRTVSRDERS
jgi:hypothetical protein